MGRYKSLGIKGLFIDRFADIFHEQLFKAMINSKLSKDQIVEKLKPKYDELIANYTDSVAGLYLANHEFKLATFLKDHFATQKSIATANKESFISFFLYLNGSAILYEKAVKQIVRKKIDSTLKMNVALYGLVVRRAHEIGNLLLSGYIDGAMIVWRSFYENSIILLLLATENNSELADKYYEHSIRNSQKKATSYDKYCKELGFTPLPKSTHKNLRDSSENLNLKYGREFLDNEFGWADDLFPGKQKANFRLIEERVEKSRYRPFYLWCCEQIHANFNGLNSFMDGNRLILPRILRQEIDLQSFIDPMQFTVSVLEDINDYFLYEFSTPDEYEVNMLLMRKIFEQQQGTFGIQNVKSKKAKPTKPSR